MAAPTLPDYIKRKALQVENLQTLISYYGELYQFYSDKLPNNKYINYLEENIFNEGFSTMPPALFEFLSLRPDQLSLLQPYIRLFKKFNLPGGKTKKIEFPFENKTDLESFKDPQAYIGEQFPFVAQRFNGPTAFLEGISIEEGGIDGHAVTSRDADWVRVNFNLFLQDTKLLFKNWGTKEFPIRYRDLFAVPGTSAAYSIILEVGYSAPDGADESVKIASQSKAVYELYTYGLPSSYDYEESGELSIRFQLQGRFERIHDSINLLDQKYYKKLKKANNMIVLEEEDDAKVSIKSYEEEINKLVKRETSIKEQLDRKDKTKVNKENELKNSLAQLQQKIKSKRQLVQLANSSGALPSSFPFITALYEAGLIYYFELDDDVYKDYIKKIAKGEAIDVSDIQFLPKRNQKNRLEPIDFLKKNPNTSAYFTNKLKIERFNTDQATSSDAEKIKYFYFGDLIQVILNNAKGTGVGQELDQTGGNTFSYLFGQIMWIKDEKTKILYNILNTPISLDMFLFEINKEIFQKNLKFMSLNYFLTIFMKRFFDITVFAYEKAVSGQQNQKYFAGTSYVLDKQAFQSGTQFKRRLYDYVPTSDTKETVVARLITAMPKETGITPQIARKRNIPKFYVGGVDKGPLKRISFSTSPLNLQAEYEFAKRLRMNTGVLGETIGNPSFESAIVSSDTRLSISLVGNVFFKIADYIFMDTRFVDGGFFTQEDSLVFFSGYFVVEEVSHRISAQGEWTTNIRASFLTEVPKINSSYKANPGEVPKTQNVDIADGANLSKQAIIHKSKAKSTVDKKTSSPQSAQASSKGSGTPTTPAPAAVNKKN